MNIKRVLPLLASLICLLAACSSKTNPVTGGAAEAVDPNRPIVIDNFSLGTRLGPHGGIAQGANESMFAVGELIYLAMELKYAPIGTVIHVVWKAQPDIVLGEETKEVRRGQRFVNFAAETSSLPIDQKYYADIYVNGKPLTRVEFGLVMASA